MENALLYGTFCIAVIAGFIGLTLLTPRDTTQYPRGLQEFARKVRIWDHQAMKVYQALDQESKLELQTCHPERALQIYEQQLEQMFKEYRREREVAKVARKINRFRRQL